MKQGVYQGTVFLPAVDTAWSIAGAADLDGDGYADVVWQNLTTGARSIWLLKSGVYQGTVSLPTIDPAWRIAGRG